VLDLDLDTVRFPNGTEGQLEMIRHPGASAVVPFLDSRAAPDPRILLIRQYRYAAERFLYEVPAGRLDPGEVPIDCARRELLEETGSVADVIEPLGAFFTTPGFTDEFIHAFSARVSSRVDARLEHDEFIAVEELPLSSALAMIDRGEIIDAKTIVSLFLAERRRGMERPPD
jgi:ADP-ribose pyrophosphatase